SSKRWWRFGRTAGRPPWQLQRHAQGVGREGAGDGFLGDGVGAPGREVEGDPEEGAAGGASPPLAQGRLQRRSRGTLPQRALEGQARGGGDHPRDRVPPSRRGGEQSTEESRPIGRVRSRVLKVRRGKPARLTFGRQPRGGPALGWPARVRWAPAREET